MRAKSVSCAAALYVLASLCAAQSQTVANGVFVGRSGKPIVKAHLMLAEVAGDEQFLYTRLKLVRSVADAVTDEKGRFQFRGFTPGTYTIVYEMPGTSTPIPVEIGIKAFLAETASTLPLMRDIELGRGENYPVRPWGKQFYLMKGHTFYGNGPNMKIWNATARRGQTGPYFEIRKGLIWLERLDNNSQIKFDSWSN